MEKNYRYAIRKTTLGVGSVAIAAFLAGQGQEVQAAEQPSQPSSALAVDAVNPADQAGFYAAEGTPVNTDQPASGEDAKISGLPADTVNGPIVAANPDNPNYSENEKNVGHYRQSELANNGISYSATETEGKTEGVTHKVLNPSANTPDDKKKDYGIDISIDRNDSERTYNLIGITDSKKGVPIRPKVKPYEEVGQPTHINGKSTNFTPTTTVNITTGRQRALNSTFNEDDLKYINNHNNKETTFSFRDKYTKDNQNGTKFLEGGNFAVTFGVNPYPNENANLSIIKVAGDTNVNRVAVKEGYVKTGAHIENLDPADYDRVVGQVYHPDGSIVPQANAFIITPKNIEEMKGKLGNDIQLGQIIFAMPKGALEGSKDPDSPDYSIFNTDKFKGIQSLQARFFARPRTKEEFVGVVNAKNDENGTPYDDEWAYKYVETGAGTQTLNHNGQEVIADKQGIARYDNYNDLGSITINLDDTRYYDQKFNQGFEKKTDKVTPIRPGQDKVIFITDQDMDPAIEPNRKTYEEMNVAGNKKFATGVIDPDFVKKAEEKGWKVESTPGDISKLKVTAPADAKAGEFIPILITYTYTNGSTDLQWFHFVVQDSNNNKPEYHAEVGYQGDNLTNIPEIPQDSKKLDPKTFELVPQTGGYKDDHGNVWHGVKIDPQTGAVTATVPTDANIIGGENVYIPVKVNYTDPKSGQHKEEFVKAQFIARPKYKTTVTDTDDKLIPYETKEVIDETLPAGTIQVVTPGKVGKERTIFEQDVINGQKGLIDPATGQFTAGDQLFRKRTETIEEKQDRLVKVGTKPVEETVTIPRPVEVEVDPNMEPTAEPVVVEEGQDGVVTVKTTRDPQTGAVNITKATTTPARPKKVKVGTKTTGTVVDNDEIPFKYTVEFDPDFYKNYPDATENYKVVTPGQAGSNKKTWTIENSKVVGDPAVETVAPVNAVIKVGQKDYTGSFETVDKDLIPYETEYIVDNTLEPGKEVVENPGELGEKTTTTTHTIQNGQVIASTPGQSTQTKDPVKRVVRIGAKSSGSYQVTEPISFQVEVKKDPSLKKGEYKVETPGKPGSQTKTLTIENSQVTATSEPTINEQATNAVVLVGDQDFTGEVSHDVTEKVPFPVKIVEDPTLDKGTYHVDQEGVPGSKTTTYTQAIKNGVADGALTSTVKAESAPQEHIIRVGTKPLTGSTTVTTTNQKPFDVEIEYDNTKPAGTVEVVPNTGVPGEETKTTPVTAADGTVTPGTTTTTETKAPVNKKIIVGTQGYNGEFSHEYTNIVPFETEVEVDPSLAPNAVVEVQKGQLGETTTKVSQTITNGVPGEKVVSDPVQTKTPVNRKIKVGAKTEGVHTYTEELPFSYTVEYDPAIQAGKYEIVTPGAVGSRTTEWPITNSVVGQGKVTQEIPATNALIKVGNKDFTGQVTHTETVPVPNTVEIRYNPNVKAGETKVLEAGKPGSVDVTYSQAIKNGQADGDLVKTEANRVDPVNRVIEVGTQPVSGTETPIQQDVPVEVEYVYDNTKDKGFIEAGQVTPGTTQSKVVSKVVDGQVVNTVENVVTPAKQQIIVGTKDYTGNFEYKDTDVIPNHTQVTINPNLAPNEIKVVEAGNTGLKERTVSQSFTNGKLGEQVVGDYTTVKEPKDRVIEIGAKTTGSFKDTDTIPFEVEVKYDPTLKKGEWKYATVDGLEQRGVAGEKERTLTIENSQVTNISDFTTTKVPQKAVILVGNEDLTGNFTTVDKDPIPFEVEVKVDPSLAPGKEVVDQEGVPGEEETPTTHQIVNGQVTASMPGETKQTKAPVKKIVRLGAKTDGTYTHKDALPFEVEVRKAPDLKKGQTRVLQEGQPGEQTTTVTIENSQVVGSPSTTITKAPVKHIIEVGDQDFTGEVSHNVTETLPFKVEIQEDPNLPLFEIQEVQKGENGSKTTKYSQSIKNGAADGQLKTEEIARIEPKTHIIKVGTKAPENAETRVKEVPAEIEYVYDNTKDKGIVEKGAYTPGKVETKIKNIFNPQTGQIETTTEEVVTPAKQVIVVGAKDFTGDYKFSNTCPVPFPVEIRENPDLPAGTSKTVQAGVPGSKTTDYTQALKNGQAEGAPVSQDGAYTAPKAHIIEVGTKPVAGNTHESNKDVPVETIFEYDPNLNKGKVETVQVVPGHVTTKLVNKVVNGQVVTEEVPVVTPAKHIVKVGTKDFTGSFTTVDKNPVPFEVEYKLDPSLAPGTEVVDQEGVVGEEETPTTHTIVNGQVTESTPGQTTQTKAPVKKIVRIGAKTDGSYTHTEEIPFQVKVEVDPSLPKGEYKVETPGQVGQKTTTVTIENSQFVGSPNVVVTKEPVTEIIKLGGKDFTGQVSHTEHFETAFKVIVRRNENLKPGQVKTVQEGVKGSYDVTFTQKIKNGQADGPLQADRHNEVAALDHIIEVGPDCPICPVPGQPDQPGQDKPNTDKPNEDKPGDNTTLGGHTPEEGNPEKPQPGDPTPGSDQPENPSSSDKIPGNNTPDGQTSEEPQPGDKKPGQGTSDPDRPGGSSSNGRVPEKHPSDDNTPGNPTPGAEIPEENISKDKDSEGDSSTDKQPAGTVQSDQPVGEDPALDPASSASLSPASHKTSSTPSHQSVQVASVLPQTGAVASVTGVGLSLLLAGLGCLGLDRKKKK